jgi:hypothetical protein
MPRSKSSKAKIADPGPTVTAGKNGALYLNTNTTWNKWRTFKFDEDAFDPSNVNWSDLLTLYQDDPLLAAVFEAMKEWSKSEDHDPNYKYQWTLNGPGTVLSTTSNVGISNSFTLSYDSSGTATLTEDK